jgi:ferredoxin-like protein FixX
MMDAVKFTRAAMRMCNDYYSKCWSCPAGDNTSCKLDSSYSAISAEEKVAIVEQWAERHPAKTRQSEFLKHYPDARILAHGCLNACPMDVFSDADINCNAQPCFECKKAFWLAEVEE